MRLPPSILALPTSLLLLLDASSLGTAFAAEDGLPQIERPRGFPAHIKFFPEDPPNRRRDLEAIQEHIIAGHIPVVVKKMSEDESEKFFPEYWGFAEPDSSTQFSIFEKDCDNEAELLANASLPLSMRPALAFHTENENSLAQLAPLDNGIRALRALRARSPAVVLALLEKRGFQCPGGTSACTSIGYPNLCCGTGDGCFLITDTGLGPVGCCPKGATCAGTVTSCEPGNTPCPSDLGGGCCLPGYTCAGVGCIPIVLTVVTTITATISASSTRVVVTTTTISTTSTRPSSSTYSSPQTTSSSCPPGDQSCPAALGGGCCPTDRVCMTGFSCAPSPSATPSATPSTSLIGSSTTTATPVAPIRPTTDATTSSIVITSGACPTGYYACSAYYFGGGCCRVGRDCQTSNCPSTASTTLVNSGITIVVPLTGSATTTAGSTCATGWYSCDASVGGACCPSGWTCGLESCTTIGPSSTSVEAKNGTLNSGAVGTRPEVRSWNPLVMAVSFVIVVLL